MRDGECVEEADRRLEVAVHGHDDGNSRSKSFSHCKLTALRLRHGHPAGRGLAEEAITLVTPLRSGRSVAELRGVVALLDRDDPLRDRAAPLLTAGGI
jgi:hypothetical protein